MAKHKRESVERGAAWNEAEFLQELGKLDCLSPSQADNLRFHLKELLGCCTAFQAKVDALTEAFGTAPDDSTQLWNDSSNLLGELEHIRYHIRGAMHPMRRIQGAAREMHPIGEMSDEALTEETVEKAYDDLKRIGVDLRKPRRKTRDRSTGKPSNTERKA